MSYWLLRRASLGKDAPCGEDQETHLEDVAGSQPGHAVLPGCHQGWCHTQCQPLRCPPPSLPLLPSALYSFVQSHFYLPALPSPCSVQAGLPCSSHALLIARCDGYSEGFSVGPCEEVPGGAKLGIPRASERGITPLSTQLGALSLPWRVHTGVWQPVSFCGTSLGMVFLLGKV